MNLSKLTKLALLKALPENIREGLFDRGYFIEYESKFIKFNKE